MKKAKGASMDIQRHKIVNTVSQCSQKQHISPACQFANQEIIN